MQQTAGRARAISFTKLELDNIKRLYESTMAVASHGLFFRTGRIVGERIAEAAKNSENFADAVAVMLMKEGWVSSAVLADESIQVNDSIEVTQGFAPTCHILRGIFSMIYEKKLVRKVYCHEVECESTGAKQCTFKIDTQVI